MQSALAGIASFGNLPRLATCLFWQFTYFGNYHFWQLSPIWLLCFFMLRFRCIWLFMLSLALLHPFFREVPDHAFLI